MVKCNLCDNMAVWIDMSSTDDKEPFLFCDTHLPKDYDNIDKYNFEYNKNGWGKYKDLYHAYYPIS